MSHPAEPIGTPDEAASAPVPDETLPSSSETVSQNVASISDSEGRFGERLVDTYHGQVDSEQRSRLEHVSVEKQSRDPHYSHSTAEEDTAGTTFNHSAGPLAGPPSGTNFRTSSNQVKPPRLKPTIKQRLNTTVGAAALTGALAGALASVVALSLVTSITGDGPRRGDAPIRNAALVASENDGILDADSRLLQAVRATRPAVVTIWNLQHARRTMTSPVRLEPVTSGSGVIFDERGYIATNHHVVDNARSIEVVFLDGRRAEALLVRSDPAYDIAILKLPEGFDLPAVAPLADSALLEPGLRVVAIGSPLGTEYQNTVTSGIIAGLNRNITTRSFDVFRWRSFEQDINATPLIQTDAAINNGNSGGPLIDLAGRVVGLNTAVLRRSQGNEIEGLGFAVPSNVVQSLADEWIDGELRASLGIGFRTIDPDFARINGLSRGSGALVEEVPAGGAGERAGLFRGDRIVAIDGIPLDLDHALTDLLWGYRAGDTARLSVEREEGVVSIDVKLDAWAGGQG